MKTDIGERIRQQRVIKGFSQEYMANELDISTSAYSNIETGKTDITVKRAFEIANILGLSIIELIVNKEDQVIVHEPDNMGYKKEMEIMRKEIEKIKKQLENKSTQEEN